MGKKSSSESGEVNFSGKDERGCAWSQKKTDKELNFDPESDEENCSVVYRRGSESLFSWDEDVKVSRQY